MRGSPKPAVSESRKAAGSRVMGCGKVAMPRSTETSRSKGASASSGVGQFDDDGAAGGTAEGVFVDVAKAEAAKNDAAVGGAYLDVPGWRRRVGGCARARG